MFFSIFHVVFLLTLIHQSMTSEWDYGHHGPDVWSEIYPSCAGSSQSPINIRTPCTTYQSFEPFQFSSFYDQFQDFTLINNGHTISGTLTSGDSSSLTLTEGGLSGTYQFSSFHFHWGENYNSGSEHEVNDKKYSGEAHFIHIDPTTGQIAVLGIFLESNDETNSLNTKESTITEWEKFLLAAEQLQEVNAPTVLTLNLASLMNTNFNNFWRYTGSLTTPPCTEGIIWTVFQEPTIVNDHQFENLRNNLYSKVYREPQPIYDRMIYQSFLHEEAPPSDDICSSK